MNRRAGLYDSLEKAFVKSFYADEDDAINRAKRKAKELTDARDKYAPAK